MSSTTMAGCGAAAAGVASATAIARRQRSARIAFVRGAAMFLVVLIHTTAAPDAPSFTSASVPLRIAAAITHQLSLDVAVPAFLMLAFMPLHPALAGRRGYGRRLWLRCLHILPVYLSWTGLYAALKIVLGGVPATPARIAEYLVLGTSAVHLKFLPLLLALTALAPLWVAIAARPALAGALAVALPLGASYAADALSPGSAWVSAALGIVGNGVYPIAAMALVERWRGWEPPVTVRHRVLAVSAVAASVAGAILVGHALAEASAAATLPWTLAERTARFVFPVGMVTVVLSSRVPLPPWAELVAPLSFGVYLLHPLVVKPLRALEAHVPAFATHEVALALPNAVLAFGLSLAIVFALVNTRLRRLVT